MTPFKKICGAAGALGLSLFAALPSWAQDAAEAAAPAVPNPGNNAWMMTATVLVLLMILPGLALIAPVVIGSVRRYTSSGSGGSGGGGGGGGHSGGGGGHSF